MSENTFDVLLLLALPASGKSELRKYMDALDPVKRVEDLHIGDTVQLDDFPYVHFLQMLDQALEDTGAQRKFFKAKDRPAKDPAFWGALTELLNQDFAALASHKAPPCSTGAAKRLVARVEEAYLKSGAPSPLDGMDQGTLDKALSRVEDEAEKLEHDLAETAEKGAEDATVVIEFARGGPQGSTMPLQGYLGYQYALSHLSPEILGSAAILYVLVTPEDSRRKNMERADPKDPGSILHHGVPEEVMLQDYGCDDMEYLLSKSSRPDTVEVTSAGQSYVVPAVMFDNRSDMTTFLRGDPSSWDETKLQELHSRLAAAMSKLYEVYKETR